MEIVLVEPEIPPNTGNIARTCALTGNRLHLVKPLGFSLDDKYMKRAGLDYWNEVEVKVWDCFDDLYEYLGNNRHYFLATTKAKHHYHEVSFKPNDVILFGRETKGLSQEMLDRFPEGQIRIPMRDLGRSLNLSNSVAIILYEALRQQNFIGLI